MPYQLFLSHSGRDIDLMAQVRDVGHAVGVSLYLFEHDCQPGRNIARKLQTAIHRSNAVLVLLTHNTVESPYVHQEVGYAIRERKPIVPLVDVTVATDQLGMLAGVEYIRFDPAVPAEAMTRLAAVLERRSRQHAQDQMLLALLAATVLLAVVTHPA